MWSPRSRDTDCEVEYELPEEAECIHQIRSNSPAQDRTGSCGRPLGRAGSRSIEVPPSGLRNELNAPISSTFSAAASRMLNATDCRAAPQGLHQSARTKVWAAARLGDNVTCPTGWVPTLVANCQAYRKADPRATRLSHRVPNPGNRFGPSRETRQADSCRAGHPSGHLVEWLRQDDIDHGLRPGKPSMQSAELRAARRRIRELETELAIIRHAAKFLGEDTSGPKDGSTR